LLDLARDETDPFCQWTVDQGTSYGRVWTTTRALEDGAFAECTAFLDGLGVVADLFRPEEFAVRCAWQARTIRGMIEKVSGQLFDYLHFRPTRRN
jgi:hypothetical protein